MAKSLESEIYASRFDDGVLDLLVGVGLLVIGLFWRIERPELGAAVPAILIPLWIALRRTFIEPRLGRVAFAPERRRIERGRLTATIALGVALLTCAALAAVWLRGGATGSLTPRALAPLVPALLLGLGFAIVSLLIGARRFLTYAMALVALGAITAWRDGEPWTYMTLGGGLLAVWAAVLVARFLTSHPNLETSENR